MAGYLCVCVCGNMAVALYFPLETIPGLPEYLSAFGRIFCNSKLARGIFCRRIFKLPKFAT